MAIRQPEICLLDFSNSHVTIAPLVQILMRAADVNRLACTISSNGTIEGTSSCANPQAKSNGLFVMLLPAKLQQHAISVLQHVKHECPPARTIIVLEAE